MDCVPFCKYVTRHVYPVNQDAHVKLNQIHSITYFSFSPSLHMDRPRCIEAPIPQKSSNESVKLTNIVEPDAASDILSGLLDNLVPVHVRQQTETESAT